MQPEAKPSQVTNAMPTKTTIDESELLLQLSRDSHDAFRILFDTYKDHIYKVALLYVKSPAHAEEIVQEVFMKIWAGRGSLSQVKSFESWLFITTKHFIFNYNKRLALDWKVTHAWQSGKDAAVDDTDHKVKAAEYEHLLARAMEQLSRQQQEVYRLSRVEGLSHREIGGRLDISPLTVKTHLARAIQALRLFIKEQGEIIPLLIAALCLQVFF